MAKYIPLDAVLAIIEKFMYDANLEADIASTGECFNEKVADVKYQLCKCIKGKIDTLEVKEVDLERLEQEVKDFCYEYDDRKEKWYELCPNDKKLLYNPTWANFAMSIAKHFFELGLSASNPIAEVDLESLVRQVIDLYLEAGKHYDSVIKEERKEYSGSDLAIKLLGGAIDAKELGVQYVLDKLKAQKGEKVWQTKRSLKN